MDVEVKLKEIMQGLSDVIVFLDKKSKSAYTRKDLSARDVISKEMASAYNKGEYIDAKILDSMYMLMANKKFVVIYQDIKRIKRRMDAILAELEVLSIIEK